MTAEAIDLGRVVLLPVIRGLTSERIRVRRAIQETRPAIVAMSISRQELEALRVYGGGTAEPSGPEEEAYVAGLSAFGDVEKPPPCFTEALAVAGSLGLTVHSLDLDEDAFSDAYLREVSGLEFVVAGVRRSRIRRWRPRAASAEAFVVSWDARVNRSRGLRALQRLREAHIAARLWELSRAGGPLLALVDFERSRGVAKRLGNQLPT